MDHRLIQFDRQLRQVIGPALEAAGFFGEPLRCWRREVRHEGTQSQQIVEFEVGTLALEGLFTANLGIFNIDHLPSHWPAVAGPPHPRHCLPGLSVRLDRLAPRAGPNWLARMLRRKAEPGDTWWHQVESAYGMQRCLQGVLRELDVYGLTWLDSHTSVAAFKAARDRLQAERDRARRAEAPPPD